MKKVIAPKTRHRTKRQIENDSIKRRELRAMMQMPMMVQRERGVAHNFFIFSLSFDKNKKTTSLSLFYTLPIRCMARCAVCTRSVAQSWIHLSFRSFSLLPRLMLIALGLKNKIYEKSVFPSASPSIIHCVCVCVFFSLTRLHIASFARVVSLASTIRADTNFPSPGLTRCLSLWPIVLIACGCALSLHHTMPQHATPRHATPRHATEQHTYQAYFSITWTEHA